MARHFTSDTIWRNPQLWSALARRGRHECRPYGELAEHVTGGTDRTCGGPRNGQGRPDVAGNPVGAALVPPAARQRRT
ncbi:MAG: hypothetical protein IJ087_14535, partial [Eggerthellaceae bacterium]|nr:hypothetical protein [Eggerthellaceae bacterium]